MGIPLTFNEAVKIVASDIAELLIKKQMDYGKDNIMEFGEFGVLVRINDKFSRLKNLMINNKKAINESKTDTWRDIAGYAVIALMLDNNTFDLPLE